MSELGVRLIRLVREKAAEKPDFVYIPPDGPGDSCAYVHDDGRPGCLIGHALFDAGIIDASLGSDSMNTQEFENLAQVLDLPLDEEELSWLCDAQAAQDLERSWGQSVKAADLKSYLDKQPKIKEFV